MALVRWLTATIEKTLGVHGFETTPRNPNLLSATRYLTQKSVFAPIAMQHAAGSYASMVEGDQS